MSERVLWGDAPLCWQDVVRVAREKAALALSDSAWQRIAQGRSIVQHIIDSGQIAYGINTGLGALCNITLPEEQLGQLSRNTLLSHACGVGPLLDEAHTRAIMCAAIANYSHGKSGISCAIVEQLLAFLNLQITPQVPSQGSVGYLTHMAHIGLALMGIGDVSWQGQVVPAEQALAQAGLEPIAPGAKEGLSLVNGTPCMTGMACLALDDAARLLDWADVTGAMSFEALCGQAVAFDAEILALKASPGMQHCGLRLRQMLTDSPLLAASQGVRTQDALSLRSMPQVHGACRDQFAHAAGQVDVELNACTDNPLILGRWIAGEWSPRRIRTASRWLWPAICWRLRWPSSAPLPSGVWIGWLTRSSAACRRFGGKAGGEFRDDDCAVRRGLAVRGKQAAGAARGAR
ncbi:Histidine ammonia-lyase [Raoultella terrigena]|uniref:Histidine ammonia-lyase n=1 Tax=Raoultella terrigena TaxID=577 RepID=A0A485BFP4_RAOTE|nr:Histidine ammonia-lyase [Raoultella terrigena]